MRASPSKRRRLFRRGNVLPRDVELALASALLTPPQGLKHQVPWDDGYIDIMLFPNWYQAWWNIPGVGHGTGRVTTGEAIFQHTDQVPPVVRLVADVIRGVR